MRRQPPSSPHMDGSLYIQRYDRCSLNRKSEVIFPKNITSHLSMSGGFSLAASCKIRKETRNKHSGVLRQSFMVKPSGVDQQGRGSWLLHQRGLGVYCPMGVGRQGEVLWHVEHLSAHLVARNTWPWMRWSRMNCCLFNQVRNDCGNQVPLNTHRLLIKDYCHLLVMLSVC